ncbi:nicotinate-nicotinamide nucleotide adenylyltransferase [Aliiglaciecola sp. LCG003]|uniref:nicotinate-nicotinamide nucleotide adenylyltransferase n=1 Tax=Aliiglaciecola sp. LCG003 TaxID=3053655 RepID=UPI002574338C|nr:nicotinate-nicotinamide nucleotide adenylyltransferase [Aliiglaciecola sp. LCG003]WJG10727.1 nicotinate-nicotinamide nucleotide adenylyltransferase [Aliiglaciecola sp. LCG003]
MNIAVFGSAFNPPTNGHKDVIEYLLGEQQQFEQILLVPSFEHAFAKKMIPYQHRVNMLQLFVDELNNEKVIALPVEDIISDGQRPVYTYDLMHYLQQALYPTDSLSFIIGPDNVDNWHRFYRADDIMQRWQRLVVPERIDVRATYVREGIEKGNDIKGLLPASVYDYITKNKLYA